MRQISIPLVQSEDGRITYLGDFTKWREAHVVGDKLVGFYDGDLYHAGGTEKMFAWTESDELGRDQAEQIQEALKQAVQAHLDATARSYGYDSIYTAVTYADEPAVAKFQNEGLALRAWRSLAWGACHIVLADVLSGARATPTAAELIAELPVFTPPV